MVSEGRLQQTPPFPSTGVYRFIVGSGEQGVRLDQFLAARSSEFSRGMARRLVDLGGVHVDGRRVRTCGLLLAANQKVEVFVDGFPLKPFVLDRSRVLYQDQYLLAVNKPAGVATQPTPARYRGTLYDALQRYLTAGCNRPCKPSIGMVQRLDRDTSGVLAFSIHRAGHKGLTEAFREHTVRKVYLALVAGEPSEATGRICSHLARKRSTNRALSVPRGGRYAETRYRVVFGTKTASLLGVEILTGRTHQIRAHLAEAGHPLVGDVDYGGPDHLIGMPVARHMLHAWQLSLAHPVGAEPLSLQAPLPEDLRLLLDHLDHPFDAETETDGWFNQGA